MSARPSPPPPPGEYGASGGGPAMGQPPDDYLVWAVLTTVLCCVPLGIVSIVFSTQVNSRWARGDAVGAVEASTRARRFAVWSAIVQAILVAVFYVGLVAFGMSIPGMGST